MYNSVKLSQQWSRIAQMEEKLEFPGLSVHERQWFFSFLMSRLLPLQVQQRAASSSSSGTLGGCQQQQQPQQQRWLGQHVKQQQQVRACSRTGFPPHLSGHKHPPIHTLHLHLTPASNTMPLPGCANCQHCSLWSSKHPAASMESPAVEEGSLLLHALESAGVNQTEGW